MGDTMSELPRKDGTILLADDEPYHLEWIEDFLGRKGYHVDVATSVDDALSRLQKARYRSVVADLSIPFRNPYPVLSRPEPIHERYPGLIIAEYARNRGHLGRQVIVYSVHDDPAVQAYSRRLGATYLLKGRPRRFKDELEDVLSYDPLAKE
jgi:DNA-binding response OmpR family regulator